MASSRGFYLSPLPPPACVVAMPHLCCCSWSCHCLLKQCSDTWCSLWSLPTHAILWFCVLFSLKPANPPGQQVPEVMCKNGGKGAEASLLLTGSTARELVPWSLHRKSYSSCYSLNTLLCFAFLWKEVSVCISVCFISYWWSQQQLF